MLKVHTILSHDGKCTKIGKEEGHDARRSTTVEQANGAGAKRRSRQTLHTIICIQESINVYTIVQITNGTDTVQQTSFKNIFKPLFRSY